MRIWLMAARPRTLPAAIAPVLVGTAAAVRAPDFDFRWGAFTAALAGSIFIQIGTNLANDYSDAKRGRRHRRSARTRARHLDRPGGSEERAGRDLDRLRGRDRLRDLPRHRRRADHPRGRRRLDPRRGPLHRRAAALRLRGPRRAVRLPLLRAGRGQRLLLRAARGARLAAVRPLDLRRLLATAILVVNNVRDIDTDRRAGKNTLAVRLGRERTRRLYVALVARRLRRPCRSRSARRTATRTAGGRCSASSRCPWHGGPPTRS